MSTVSCVWVLKNLQFWSEIIEFYRIYLLTQIIFGIKIRRLAVGAAQNHYSELAEDLYNDRQTKIYVDSSNALEHDLKGLKAPIAAEVGEVVNGTKPVPTAETTIFQSTGMC